MACSVLAFVGQVQLDAIEDVSKSFPDFFDKIKTLY
jgi:5-enolpyruvylshikimate-3-phosphate synthase